MKPLLFSILPRPPHPTRDGLAIRNFHLLRALARDFRVRAFVLKAPHLPDGEYPDGVEAREFAQAGRFRRRALAAAESLASGRAYAPLLYRSRTLSRALEAAASQERPAWIVAHSYHVGPLAQSTGDPSWIDFHNLDSQIWARVGQTASSRWQRWFASLQAHRVEAVEAALASSARGVSCVSSRDAHALEALSPAVRPVVAPNGVDLTRYAFRREPSPGKNLFFVGDLSWPPNSEAIRWFRREIWPRVRRVHPDAVAEVLGREPPADLARDTDPSFRLFGEGNDTRLHWAKAAVAVVPLRAGGGTRLKILEAAACGVPVVSTSIGAEGIEFERDREILLADDAEGFAAGIIGLLGNGERRAQMARAARARVEKLYDWDPIGRDLSAQLLARRTV
jgi:glycosyltransferase involved in cell wall biosynthesis